MKFKRGDWVAQVDLHQPHFGTVRTVHNDGTFDLVIYDHKGNQLGRVSPPMGGPKTFEPCCPCKYYAKIKQPEFPLRLNLYGDWSPLLKWL